MAYYTDSDLNPAREALPIRPRVLSVSSLNSMARQLLEGHFPAVLVEGEISNFSVPASGHWYLTLKDEKSQLRCAMFRNSNRKVRFRPANGGHVLVKGRLSLYEARGDYQLIIDDMEEAGDGALRRAFEQLKARLAEEGLFNSEDKQPVGDWFRHVAVITSASGAAIRDILTVFRRRYPAIRITVLPVAVQGNEAPGEIVAAIERANRVADQLGIEVLLVARGGGSLEDLQAFNEESVARAIHASRLPVVSGVGHEIDFTIADFVADLRAPTPSAAAELLSPNQQDTRHALRSGQQQLANAVTRKLKLAGQQLEWLSRRLKHPGKRLLDHAQTLDILDSRLRRALHWQLQRRRTLVRQLGRTLLSLSPMQQLTRRQEQLAQQQHRLQLAMPVTLKTLQSNLNQLARNLNAVSPLNTLARGFSITYLDDHEVLRNSSNVKPGSKLTTRLHKGVVESQVTRVQEPD